MSQRLVVVEIEGNVYPENLYSVPDRSEAIDLVSDYMGDDWESGNSFDVDYYWYEIGSGESGTDEFFTDKELLEMWESGLEDEMARCGLELEMVECGSYTIDSDELERNYW